MSRHRFDPFAFLFGAMFVVIGGVFLLDRVDLQDLRPGVLIGGLAAAIGLLMLAFVLDRHLSRAAATEREPLSDLEEPFSEPDDVSR